MIIRMDMSSYEVEQASGANEYGTEIMSSGWNPAVELVHEQLQEIQSEELSASSLHATQVSVSDVSDLASDIFMRKMYSFQR